MPHRYLKQSRGKTEFIPPAILCPKLSSSGKFLACDNGTALHQTQAPPTIPASRAAPTECVSRLCPFCCPFSSQILPLSICQCLCSSSETHTYRPPLYCHQSALSRSEIADVMSLPGVKAFTFNAVVYSVLWPCPASSPTFSCIH